MPGGRRQRGRTQPWAKQNNTNENPRGEFCWGLGDPRPSPSAQQPPSPPLQSALLLGDACPWAPATCGEFGEAGPCFTLGVASQACFKS